MPLDHALHPTWLAAPSAQPQFTRPPGWSRDRCRWPWRRTAAGNAYCGERRTYAVANEFRNGHPARGHHCVSHDAVFAGPCRAPEQVSMRRVQAREGHLPTMSWTAVAMGMATRAPITPNRAPPSRTANNRPSLEPNGIRVGSGPHDLPRGSHPNCHKPIGHADRRRECSGPDGVRWPFRLRDG